MSQVQTNNVVNGVDVGRLMQTIEAVKQDGALSRFQFRAANRWMGSGHTRTTIQGFYGAGKEDDTRSEPFTLDCDEPQLLLGENQGANPVEHLLNALAGCLTTTMIYHAAARGIEIESAQSQLEGDIDIQGFLGMSNEVPRGYQKIRVTLRVKSDASPEKLKELAQYSPVFDTITRPVPVEVRVVMQ